MNSSASDLSGSIIRENEQRITSIDILQLIKNVNCLKNAKFFFDLISRNARSREFIRILQELYDQH